MNESRKKEPEGLSVYSRGDVVKEYSQANYLSGAETELFERYLSPGMRVLDLGVGGGRTSPALAETAAEYIGVDYSQAMVEVCKAKFPQWHYVVMDASDLTAFGDNYFDLVVFSFNGLGNLHPFEKRHKCLRECARVLKPNGIFIFSQHHARSLFFRPPIPARIVELRPFLGSLWQSMKRFFTRVWRPFFWTQSGYFYSGTHGGMLIYLATPKRVHNQLHSLGFEVLDTLGDDYPARNFSCMTRWYYYAARIRK